MLGKLLGFGAGEVVGAAEGVANIIDRFVETDDEKRAAQALKARIAARPSEAQIELNKIEAGHRSVFVAGWRPWIGWVCGVALAWHFIGHDLAAWAAAMWAPDLTPPTLAGAGTLVNVVLAMLGLGALRTGEKLTGRAR